MNRPRGVERDEMRILVVEDEEIMAEALSLGLRRSGFAVDVAMDGTRGVELTYYTDYDVVILDRDLPGTHGDEVCRLLTERAYPARIIMLTASSGIDNTVDGLNLGADDYLVKPFVFKELLARINALSRRTGATRPVIYRVAGITADTARAYAQREDRPLDLTLKEFWVLVELLKADGGVVSAEALLEQVWDENADPFTNAVRVTMVGLRKKLGPPSIIETVRGMGYRVITEQEKP